MSAGAAMSQNRDETIANFQAITGIDDVSRCVAILEEHSWHLETAAAVSLASYVAIMIVKPAIESLPCPSWAAGSSVLSRVEDLLSDVWSMACRSSAVAMMVLWEAVLRQQGSAGGDSVRALALFTATLTFVGAGVASALEDAERRMHRRNRRDPAGDPYRASAILFADLLQSTVAFLVPPLVGS